jgi:hypothetical protein
LREGETHRGTSAGSVGRVPLVDRRRELAELDAALASARAGRGRLFLIKGEPGIGKTRLAEAIAERGAERGMLALWGRAWETGGAPSYWPWTQILRTLIATRDPASFEAELGQRSRWLVQMLPELSDQLPELARPRGAGTETARFALFDAVTSFLHTAAASTPLVVLLEDVHAADPASLLLLEFTAHGLAASRILVIATYQEAAVALRPAVKDLVGALARTSATLALGGFEPSDLGEMVEHAAGKTWPADAVDALHRTTEGNPFYSTEIVRLLAREGDALSASPATARFPLPDTIRETVRRRFDPLDAATVTTLETASVVGREFRLGTLEAVIRDEPERLLDQIDEAVSAGLVAEVPNSIGRFRFTHNLIRETLYSKLGTARAVELHAAVAEALERRYGGASDRLAELAHHFAHATPGGYARKALEYSSKAGDEAMRLFAYEEAANLYGLALDALDQLDPDPELRAQLMLAWARARARSNHLAGRDALLEAADAARHADDPRLFAEAALAMRAWPRGGGVLDDQPSGVLEEALDRVGKADQALRARLLARLAASLYYWAGTEERRNALVEEAVEIARRVEDPATLAHVLSNGQLATWGPDYTERDLGWMEELVDLIDRVGGDDELELITRNRQIDFLVELADLPAADAALRTLELRVADSSDPRTEGYVYLQRGRHAAIEGRYAEAERVNAQAEAVGSRLRDTNMVILARNQLAGIRLMQGRLDELEGQAREMTTRDVTAAWQAALVRVTCAMGHHDEARRALDQLAINDFADIPRYNGWIVTIALLSDACIELGELQRVEALYGLLRPFATRNVTTPQAVFLGPVARFLGVLAAARGDWDVAGEHFEAARATASRMNARPALVRVDLDEASMLLRRDRPGDRDRARELISRAEPIAAELGLARISEEVEALAATLGGVDGGPAAAEGGPDQAASASLRRDGGFWVFDLGPRSVRIRDSKGLRYIAILLANPGIEVHAVELLAAETGSPGGGKGGGDRLAPGAPQRGDGGPQLDSEAKETYRRRLAELREELEEAESFNDPERAARTHEEIGSLERELAVAIGVDLRDGKASSSAERARVSVTKAIRNAIKRIHEHDPILARELDATVRTGTFCVHEPDPRHPLEWRLKTAGGR